MIFVILNILFGVFLIWFSMMIDVKSDETKIRPLINISLLTSVIAFADAICMMISFFNNEKIASLFGIVMLFLVALLSIHFTLYCIMYPNFKKSFGTVFLQVVSIGFSLYLLFFNFGTIIVNQESGFVITSNPVSFLPMLTSAELFALVYVVALPLLGIIVLSIKMAKSKNIVQKQQAVFTVIALVVAWVTLALLYWVSSTKSYFSMYNTLFTFALTLLVIILYKSVTILETFDFHAVLISIGRFFYSFLFEAIIAGVIFALLQPLRTEKPVTFVLAYLGAILILLIAGYQLVKAIKSRNKNYDSKYAKRLEEKLASINYDESAEVVTHTVVQILQETLDTTSLEILIELKERFLSTAYSSTDTKIELPLDTPTFDLLLNADRSVVFKSQVESDHAYQGISRELLELFTKTNSEAMILLREGRHIFGVLFLGEKRLGASYSDYDFEVFQNLYSYFFVIGYYMKNIANESVVGTVIRELQFSGQIIQSIQENIDVINNPKVDVGYISVSAHNLGGEFVDFIRLTDDRYIMVIGDVSGKGINASMSMVILKSLIRTFLGETKDFKELVQKVNYFIRTNLPKGTFLAGLFALIDFTENNMYYINCGIPALFMYNQAYNNVIEIQGDGRVLGFVKDVSKMLRVKKVKLNPGDIVLACTDGLIESESIRGEAFGKDRVQKSILENLAYPSEKMAKFLHANLLEFTSKELEDDVSVIAVKYLKNAKSVEE